MAVDYCKTPFPWFGERLGSRLNKYDGACWEWTGAVNEKGYGVVGLNGRTSKAHRVAWELTHGAIPRGACVLQRARHGGTCCER